MPNEHIAAYLSDYLRQPSGAGYAVLLTGAWGSGKTFFIKRHFEEQETSRHLYVSIHGASSDTDLRNRFVFAAYPILKSKKARAWGSIARSAIGAFGIESDLKAEDLLEYDQYDVIIVDDLERAILPLEAVFGFINQLVEHEGQKVILIGSEDVIRSGNDKFKEIKEKTIGFTLRVVPDVEATVASIESKSPTHLAQAIREFRSDIISVFQSSGTDNLRVLSQALNEYAPIAEIVEQDDRLSRSFRRDTLKLFLAISFGYKAGHIDRGDIKSREGSAFSRIFSSDDGQPADSMELLDQKFPDVDLYSVSLDNEYLESKVCDGWHREDYLLRTIGDATAQSDPLSNPEWRNAWHYMDGNDDVTKSSFALMINKFKNREYDDAGEILHVFALLLEARTLGFLDWSDHRALREGKAYIDDLVKAGRLPSFGDDYLGGFRHGAAYGLGFTNPSQPRFGEFWQYFQRRSDDGKREKLSERIRAAAANMTTDPATLSNMISSSEVDREAYSLPILVELDAKEFATKFLASEGQGQREIMLGIATRYESNHNTDVLRKERPWLKKLRQSINGQLRGADRLTRVRIARLVEWALERPLGLDAVQGAQQNGSEDAEVD